VDVILFDLGDVILPVIEALPRFGYVIGLITYWLAMRFMTRPFGPSRALIVKKS